LNPAWAIRAAGAIEFLATTVTLTPQESRDGMSEERGFDPPSLARVCAGI